MYWRKKLGGADYNFARHRKKLPDFICLKNRTLDITTRSLCAYSKGTDYLFVHCKIRIIHLRPIRPIQLPDFRVKIAQLSPFGEIMEMGKHFQGIFYQETISTLLSCMLCYHVNDCKLVKKRKFHARKMTILVLDNALWL